MPDLKFAVFLSAVDQLSDQLGAIGDSMGRFADRMTAGRERIHEVGERMVEWGERVGIAPAVLSEGADKLYEWSEAIRDPALAIRQSMAPKMSGLGADKLAEVKEHALAFANTHPGVTAEEWAASFTHMRGISQDTEKAISADGVVGMLSRFGVDNAAATRLIAASSSNLRSEPATTGDELFAAIKSFGLEVADSAQFAQGVGRSGGAASATHTPMPELFALVGECNRQTGGGRGPMMFASMINELVTARPQGNAAIDFSHGLTAGLEHLNRQLRSTHLEEIGELKEMRVSNPEPMLTLLGNLGEVAAKQKEIGASAGAAEHHSSIARYAALSRTAIGGAAYYGLQGLAAFGTMTAFRGKEVEALSKLANWEAIALRGMYAWDAVKGIAGSIGTFSTAIGVASVSALRFAWALAASPIGLWIEGAALLAVAAYEIYKHWGAVASFFEALWKRVRNSLSSFASWLLSWAPTIGKYLLIGLTRPIGLATVEIYKHWDGIKKIFSDAMDWLKTAGLNMMKSLGEGILEAIEFPFKAASQIAGKIGGFFHFHSPPAYSPLREAVLNFPFGEELAKRFHVAAVCTEPAAEIASASMIGAVGEPPVLAAIPILRAEDNRLKRVATAGTPSTMHIHYSPSITINGSASPRDEWVNSARQHADELMRIIKDKLYRERRLQFE
jgi:hypothetical protein